MTAHNTKPSNFPWLSPYIIVKDVDKAVHFYQQAFGFAVQDVVPSETGESMHAELTYKNQLIMLGKEGGYGCTSKSPHTSGVESPMSLYVYTDNVDEFYQHALASQAKGLGKPEDMFWGDRMCRLQDPDNYIWCFATKSNA